MNKVYYSWQDIEAQCQSIVNSIAREQWRPDYVVGITRGGNIPATIISHMLDVRCEALKIALRDNAECESNCWMAEDAFGYVDDPEYQARWDPDLRKKILVVDDINDTGETLKWLMRDWQSSCLPQQDYAWDRVWDNTVKFATLVDNLGSDFKVSYTGTEVDKTKDSRWLVFPWECVGEYND